METDADGWGTDGFSLAGGSRWGVADVGRLEINIYAIAAVACGRTRESRVAVLEGRRARSRVFRRWVRIRCRCIDGDRGFR